MRQSAQSQKRAQSSEEHLFHICSFPWDAADTGFGFNFLPRKFPLASPSSPPALLLFKPAFLCKFRAAMRRAIYPGSFDPVTNGHIDVIERARKLFDEVIVAVAHNDQKQPLFSLEDRLALLRKATAGFDRVKIAPLDGLLVEFAVQQQACAVVRGLRAVSDFEFEFQMALMNRKLEGSVETIFLMPKEEYTYLSSRIVKEIARLGGDVRAFVPSCVVQSLRAKTMGGEPQ